MHYVHSYCCICHHCIRHYAMNAQVSCCVVSFRQSLLRSHFQVHRAPLFDVSWTWVAGE